jgi:hypothetical protein
MRIYEASFPPDERESVEYFKRSVSQSKSTEEARFTWAMLDGTATLGMAHLVAYRSGLVFFVYIAIRPESRGKFPVRILIKTIVDATVAECTRLSFPAIGVIFETERPEDAEDDLDLRFRKKRLAVFQSLGGQILTRCYVQPALSPDKSAVPLNLMFLPLSTGWDRDKLILDFYREVFDLDANATYVQSALLNNC